MINYHHHNNNHIITMNKQHLKRRWDHRIFGSGKVVGSREEEG